MLSLESLKICRELAGSVTLSSAEENFADTARRIDTAKRELDAAIGKLEPKKPKASATKGGTRGRRKR